MLITLTEQEYHRLRASRADMDIEVQQLVHDKLKDIRMGMVGIITNYNPADPASGIVDELITFITGFEKET